MHSLFLSVTVFRVTVFRAAVCSLLAMGPAAALAQMPFDIRFDDAPDFTTWTVPASGWQLALTITVNEADIVDTGGFGPTWQPAAENWRLWLVTQDPDGCPSWLAPQDRPTRAVGGNRAGRCLLKAEETWPLDETWLEARPGRYGLMAPEAAGSRCDRQPWVHTFAIEPLADSGHNSARTFLGPCSNSSYGYGRHPGLPQLVMVANQGPGVVMNADFVAAEPARRRNLAGFFENVGFRWRGSNDMRQVTAQMLVPRGLLSSVVAIDHQLEVGASGPLIVSSPGDGLGTTQRSCQELRSFDGSKPFCAIWSDGEPAFVLVEPTLLHAFLVAGEAPAELVDVNGDGQVDANDATASGYRVLSPQANLAIWQHLGETFVTRDLDGNGKATAEIMVPGSPVQVTVPPP